MQKFKTTLKVMALSIIGFIILTFVIGGLFLALSPQFGKSPTKEQKMEFAKTDHYKGGKFVNTTTTVMDIHIWPTIKKMLNPQAKRSPKVDIPVDKIDSLEIVNHNPDITQLTWFGHSAFLLEIDGKTILLDPMFGQSPSPVPMFAGKRYSKELPIAIEKLPFIDAIIFSHDHYDHLDYGSVQKLKDKVGQFYTPLGVGNHLISWGVPKENIHELNWWDTIMFDQIELVCTPARHFSGRGITDRNTTLWSSWVIKGANENIYFSGDGGYGAHFKEIGVRYGPFDISLMECGQYNQDWHAIHMMPEEAAQAAVDLQSKLFMPIHWGAFTLSFHDWTDPVERVTIKAKELNQPITTPKIGQPLAIGATSYPTTRWWENY
ncbi:MAG: MBL fold metallo-hydrolase [Cyclobacteriaceae bacterium]|nr:MBL fold metallo-hydrolase [Cyclobacteriaceae bacterium]